MKKILLFVLTFTVGAYSTILAQTVPPQGINYQAVARDANGNELVSKSLTVKLGLMSKSGSMYTTQWEETHSVTTNAYGLFTLVIGTGTSTGLGTQSSFSVVPWSTSDMYLNVSVNDGNGYIDLGKTQLVSVPYAFVSGSTVSGGATGATGATGITGPTGADGSANAWGLTGNAGTSSTSNFIGTTDAISFVFKTDDTERMRITSSGNVSIGGGASPTSALYVASASGKSPFRAIAYVSNKGIIVDENGNLGVGNTDPDYTLHVTPEGGVNPLYVEGSNSEIGLMVHESGFVSIGTTTNTDSKLKVQTSDVDDAIYAKVTTSTGTTINGVYAWAYSSVQNNRGVYGFANNSSASSNYGIYGSASGATTNNFGVYGYSPTSSTGSYGIYSVGNMGYTGSLTSTSDEKLKMNIVPMENMLDKVLSLQPKNYDFKTNEYKYMGLAQGKQYGLIAQDLEKVFPELVKQVTQPAVEDENGRILAEKVNYKSVNYIALVPILIESIQEQQAIIEKQNEIIIKLQKDNKVTQANFENQHTINIEIDAKLNELYKQLSALEGEKAEK